MFIDKKGKLFGKINIIDLCVILAVVIGIAGVAVSVYSIKNNASLTDVFKSDKSEEVTLEVGLLLKEVRDITRDAIIVGDEVFTTTEDEISLGKIKKIQSEPSTRNILTFDGDVYNTVIPDKYDVTVYVETKATKNEKGYSLSKDVNILFGKYYEIKTTTIKTTPMISSIKEVK